MLFGEVLLEVVEFDFVFLKELDQLPVALSHSAAGCPGGAMIVRVMPEECVPLWGGAVAENRSDADAVQMLLRSLRQACEFEEGRIKISADDLRIGN